VYVPITRNADSCDCVAQLAHETPDRHAHRRRLEVELTGLGRPLVVAGFGLSISGRFSAVHGGADPSTLLRLARTGLHEPFSGGSVGDDGHQGRTTDLIVDWHSRSSARATNKVEPRILEISSLRTFTSSYRDSWSPDAIVLSTVRGRIRYQGSDRRGITRSGLLLST